MGSKPSIRSPCGPLGLPAGFFCSQDDTGAGVGIGCGVLEQRTEPRPDLAEIGCIAHIVPIETVDMGEHELAGRRADEMCLAVDNAAIAGNHHAHRAGTIGAAVGSFEVDGGKTQGREFIPAVSALSKPDGTALN